MEIVEPDDFHHHMRDGDLLEAVTTFAANSFGRVIAMPNLKPPVRTLKDAIEYRERILAHLKEGSNFNPLMTLYLTDSTTSEHILEAKRSGIVIACKLYPAGATTNSEFGITSVANIDTVLKVINCLLYFFKLI